MSEPESVGVPEELRRFAFAEIAQNVRLIDVGDTVEVPDFRKQFDALANTLINVTVNPLFGGYENGEGAEMSLEGRLAGAVAVRGVVGLTPNGREKYWGWPTYAKLPSEVIKPPRHHGDIRNATITMLGKSSVIIPGESTIRSVDLLLQGDVYSSGRGVRSHPSARLEVQKRGSNHPRVNFTKLTGKDAEAVVAAMQKESRENSYKVHRTNKVHRVTGWYPDMD